MDADGVAEVVVEWSAALLRAVEEWTGGSEGGCRAEGRALRELEYKQGRRPHPLLTE